MTLTFKHDLDIINIHHHTKSEPPKSNGSRDINFYLVIFGPMNYFLVTDRRTDGQTDRRKATHKSPPCMSTGGLKKEPSFFSNFSTLGGKSPGKRKREKVQIRSYIHAITAVGCKKGPKAVSPIV